MFPASPSWLLSSFCVSGENMVPESPREGEASPGGRAGEAEDGVAVEASPSSPLPSPGAARIFRPGRSPSGIAFRGASPNAADWPHPPGTAATPSDVAARAHALPQSPHVVIKHPVYRIAYMRKTTHLNESICCESRAFTFSSKWSWWKLIAGMVYEAKSSGLRCVR